LSKKTKQIFNEIFENETVEEDDNFSIFSYLNDKDKALSYLKEYCKIMTKR
jgi:hypothetical protein